MIYAGWFRVYLGFLVFFLAYSVVVAWVGFEHRRVVTGRSFRFRALEDRSGSQPVGTGISSFGLLLDGCRQGVSHSNASDDAAHKVFRTRTASSNQIVAATPSPSWPKHKTSVEGAQMTLSFEAPVEMNGWFFEGIAGNSDRDPVRFAIEVQDSEDDSGPSWTVVGSPVWDFKADGSRVALPQIRVEKLIDQYDMRAPFSSKFFFIFPSVVIFTAFFCALALTLARQMVVAEALIIFGLGTVGWTSLFTFVWAAAQSSEEEMQPMVRTTSMIRSARFFVTVTVICWTNFKKGNFLPHALFAAGILLIIQEWTIDTMQDAGVLKMLWGAMLGLFLMFPLLVETCLEQVRRLKLSAVVRRGLSFWEETWDKIGAENQGKLQDLQRVVEKFVPPRGKARQLRRRSQTSAGSVNRLSLSPFDSIGVLLQGHDSQGLPDRLWSIASPANFVSSTLNRPVFTCYFPKFDLPLPCMLMISCCLDQPISDSQILLACSAPPLNLNPKPSIPAGRGPSPASVICTPRRAAWRHFSSASPGNWPIFLAGNCQ